MKRLRKKADRDKIELYHTTSSQVLKKIKDSGAILPSGNTGITSNGQDANDTPKDQLIPSGNQGGVYLGEESVLDWYRQKALNNTYFDKALPNISTDIKVNVDTNKLLPDYDDLVVELEDPDDKDEMESLFHEEIPRWQTSLDMIEQVVHSGPINVNEITGVRFITDGILYGDLESNKEEIFKTLKESMQFNSWLNFNSAINQLEEANNKIKNLEPKVAKSRLKK